MTPIRGMTANQFFAQSKAKQDRVAEWVKTNGLELMEIRAIRLDPDGAAHFNLIDDTGRVDSWICIPQPTLIPDADWRPWKPDEITTTT